MPGAGPNGGSDAPFKTVDRSHDLLKKGRHRVRAKGQQICDQSRRLSPSFSVYLLNSSEEPEATDDTF